MSQTLKCKLFAQKVVDQMNENRGRLAPESSNRKSDLPKRVKKLTLADLGKFKRFEFPRP